MAQSNPETVSLQDAAEQLGVHYMTAYRYVRTGRLPGTRENGTWQIRVADLDSFKPGRSGPAGRKSKATGDFQLRLEKLLLNGDEVGSWELIQNALSGGMEPAGVYSSLLIPSLTSIGKRWAASQVSIADEHRASAIAQRLVGRMGPAFVRPGRKKGEIALGAPPGDLHSLPTAILSDLLRGQGFFVHDLGANVPATSFVQFVSTVRDLVAIGVGATTPNNEESIRSLLSALHSAVHVPVVLGGSAIPDDQGAKRLGANHYAGRTSEDALRCFATLN